MRHLFKLLLLTLAPSVATAGSLDLRLINQGETLVDHLAGKYQAKSVLVLPFRLEVNGKQTFASGSQSQNLARAVRCVLLAYAPEAATGKHRLAILDLEPAASISHVRNKQQDWPAIIKSGSWILKINDRKDLFELSFPTFGDPAAKPRKADVLVTGVLKIDRKRSGDNEEVRAKLEFEFIPLMEPSEKAKADDPKVFHALDEEGENLFPRYLDERVTISDIPVDTHLAAGVGLGFSLTREEIDAAKTVRDRSVKAVSKAVRREGGAGVSPDDVGGMGIEILYDGTAQQIVPGPLGADWAVNAPKTGQQVSVRVRLGEKEDKSLAYVLKVNGESANRQQTLPAEECHLWLLDPARKKTDLVEGFSGEQKADGSVEQIAWKVTPLEEFQKQAAKGTTDVGYFELNVFASSPDAPPEPLQINAQGPAPEELRKTPSKSASALHDRIWASSRLERMSPAARGGGDQGLLAYDPSGAVKKFVPVNQAFPNPVLRGVIRIKYFDLSQAEKLIVRKK